MGEDAITFCVCFRRALGRTRCQDNSDSDFPLDFYQFLINMVGMTTTTKRTKPNGAGDKTPMPATHATHATHATLYIRIEARIYDKLARLAKAGHRPIAAQVAMVLGAYADKRLPPDKQESTEGRKVGV